MKYLPLMAMTGFLAGCGSLLDTTNLVDYSNHRSVKILEVPADLDNPEFNKTYVTDVSNDAPAGKTLVFDSSVPLVDSSLAAPTKNSLAIVKQGSQQVLKVSDFGGDLWKPTLDALKAMGMTVGESNQSTGIAQVRDRSQVSSPESPIGAFLNRTIGRLNKGEQYRVSVSGDTIAFTDVDGSALEDRQAQQLIVRLRKELLRST